MPVELGGMGLMFPNETTKYYPMIDTKISELIPKRPQLVRINPWIIALNAKKTINDKKINPDHYAKPIRDVTLPLFPDSMIKDYIKTMPRN